MKGGGQCEDWTRGKICRDGFGSGDERLGHAAARERGRELWPSGGCDWSLSACVRGVVLKIMYNLR